MKLLITGGAGFIGSNFIQYIGAKYPDYRIVDVDVLTYAGTVANVHDHQANIPNYEFVRADIGNYKVMREVAQGADAIIHFAAESHVDRSIADAQVFLKTNVLGTANLLQVARDVHIPRFHQVSTDEVFGQLGDVGAFNEQSSYAPRNPYSASKASADHLVRAYHETYGLPITISNCSNNFGPRQFPEKFIPLAITNLLQGKKIPVYGQGLNIRDWLYVDDHCVALDLILHKGKIGETYCIGGGTEKRNIDLAHGILKYFGLGEDMLEFVEDRKGHDYRYAIDSSKIHNELGWRPSASFEQSLHTTIQWYQDHKGWWKPILAKEHLAHNEKITIRH